ncbi:hypothetical protein NE237_002405 [Protea cynaroides]|uniref:Uncharacterized protein n=1 Tax=Protea cynaroides TaxID=273540 RepID=A0A9Q0KVD7_9MAGN|nr:hypothetical protein NE237_002405 [Protea cynaroides]
MYSSSGVDVLVHTASGIITGACGFAQVILGGGNKCCRFDGSGIEWILRSGLHGVGVRMLQTDWPGMGFDQVVEGSFPLIFLLLPVLDFDLSSVKKFLAILLSAALDRVNDLVCIVSSVDHSLKFLRNCCSCLRGFFTLKVSWTIWSFDLPLFILPLGFFGLLSWQIWFLCDLDFRSVFAHTFLMLSDLVLGVCWRI